MTALPGDAELIIEARQVRERAHAPYSGFKVGAVALTRDGRRFPGVNVENASYGLTICAERSALCALITAGALEAGIASIAVVADSAAPVAPCGACRQFIYEFGADIRLILANLQGQARVMSAGELLPFSFDARDLPALKEDRE